MTYFNTTHVRGQQLAEYEATTDKQEIMILEFFRNNPEAEITPEDIMKLHPGFCSTPITSIRRAFTNLYNEGYIYKTDNQIKGMYGKPIYTWKYIESDQRGFFS